MHRNATILDQPDRQRLSACESRRAQRRVPATLTGQSRNRLLVGDRRIERREIPLDPLAYLPLDRAASRQPSRQRVLHRSIHREKCIRNDLQPSHRVVPHLLWTEARNPRSLHLRQRRHLT